MSGARLYTETRGAGPLLLFVVGGNGDPAVFSGVAGRLAGGFTVVTYARRGFARSPVDGPAGDADRIRADVEDAVALIAHARRHAPLAIRRHIRVFELVRVRYIACLRCVISGEAA